MDTLSKLAKEQGDIASTKENKENKEIGGDFKLSKVLPPILEDDDETDAAQEYDRASLNDHFHKFSLDSDLEEEGAAALPITSSGFGMDDGDFMDDDLLDMNLLEFDLPGEAQTQTCVIDPFTASELGMVDSEDEGRSRRRHRHTKKM